VASKRSKVQSLVATTLRSRRYKDLEPEKAPCAKHKASWEGSARAYYQRWDTRRPFLPLDMVLVKSRQLRCKYPVRTCAQHVSNETFKEGKKRCRAPLSSFGSSGDYTITSTRDGYQFINSVNNLMIESRKLFEFSLINDCKIPLVSTLVAQINIAVRADHGTPEDCQSFRLKQFKKFLGYFLRKHKKLVQSNQL